MIDFALLNPIHAIWLAYLAGVITSLTPCVYPLIPVMVGIIAGRDAGRFKSFLYSLLYVLGISITYAILGIVASFGGMMFGLTAYNPWVNIGVATVIFIFGLSYFEIVKIPMLSIKYDRGKFQGHAFGLLFMGMISGLVAAPCSTPVLGSILSFVAINKSLTLGALLLFVYGFGSGTLLIAVGTFAGFAAGLPKSGHWLDIIKKVMGVLMISIAIYFYYRGLKAF